MAKTATLTKNEAIETIKNGHIAEGLLCYAMMNGATAIAMKEGLWINRVDDQWAIKCNGKLEDVENVPAASWYIEFNGWPAGIIGILGDGMLCAGAEGNEENLRAALLKNIEEKITA